MAMSISLSDVVSHFGHGLEPLVGDDSDRWRAAFARPVRWASYTNLIDPSPYLRGGELVLTTGPGAVLTDPAAAAEYTRRLRRVDAAGILLGPTHPSVGNGGPGGQLDRLPPMGALREACDRERLPLLWSGSLVFIEFVRELGDVIRRDQAAIAQWLASAQQRITDAALSDGGPSAVVEQLAVELDTWVVCFNDVARPVHRSRQTNDLSAGQHDTLRSSAVRVLETGLRGAMRLEVEGLNGQLQTLGPAHDLLGAVATGLPNQGAPGDVEARRQLLSWGMALLSVSMVRGQEVRRAESGLGAAVLRLLQTGAVEAAHRTAAPFSPLPDAPVSVVAACAEELSAEQVAAALERRHRGARALVTVNEGTAVMIIGRRDLDQAGESREALSLGISQPVLYDSISTGLDQAQTALRRALTANASRLEYRPIDAGGMLAAVRGMPGLDLMAVDVLRPLFEVDRGRTDALVETLRVWLNAGGQWEASANRLHVHRHTLRARIEKCGRVLGVDLRDADQRHALWLAMQALPASQAVTSDTQAPQG